MSNNATTYRKEYTVSLRHGHTNTDRPGTHFFYLNPSSYGTVPHIVPDNLASHAHVILTSHIVFQDINRMQ